MRFILDHFDRPELLWLLLLAAPIVVLGVRSLAAVDPVRRWVAIGLRLIVLTLIVLMLAGFQSVRWHDALTVVAVVDESESVRRFVRPPPLESRDGPASPAAGEALSVDEWTSLWLRHAAEGRRPDDRLGVVGFDARPVVHATPSLALRLDRPARAAPREGTDIASALRQAIALFPPDSNKRLVLLSDGVAAGATSRTAADGRGFARSGDSGAVLEAALEAVAAGVRVDVVPLEYRVQGETLVEAVHVPPEAHEGQTVALRVVLRATEPASGTLHVRRDGEPIAIEEAAAGGGLAVTPEDWTLEEAYEGDGEASASGRYVHVRPVTVTLEEGGPRRFEAIFEPATGPDAMPSNNRAEAFTYVQGKGRVLVASNLDREAASVLPGVLAAHDMLLDTINGWEMPASLPELQRYDAVILQNVPAEMVTPAQQTLLSRYVTELGGGLVMIGGPDSFGAGGWTNSEIDRILPVDCEIPSQMVMPAGALVIVMDRSGSMAGPAPPSSSNKLQVANEAAVLALNTLYPQDMLGVVAFDDSASWVIPLQMNPGIDEAAKAVRSIHPGGGTNIYSGLAAAYEALAPLGKQVGVKHVILLTDGQSQGGDYPTLLNRMSQDGITLSTIGVGTDVNGPFLEDLAKQGAGAYHAVDDPLNLPQVFIKEARLVRKALIKEVDFTPQVRNVGSPVMTGISSVPPLRGFVLTANKGGGARPDARVFQPLEGPENEPIFAHWQVGLGRTAAFTSDASNRWGVDWMAWGGYGDFWNRTVRLVARPTSSRDFDVTAEVVGDKLRVRLDAAGVQEEGAAAPADSGGAGGAFANRLKVTGTVLLPVGEGGGSAGDAETVPVTLRQTGPGLYEAEVDAAQQGHYLVNLLVESPDGQRRSVFAGASRSAGAELRRFTSDRALLEQVAAITGGRVLDPARPAEADLFNRESVVPSRSVRPMWRPLLVALLVLFLLDVASRRLAWDLRGALAWLRGAAETAGDRFRAREAEAAATMGALKARAAQVERQLTAPPAEATPRRAAPPPHAAAEEAPIATTAAAQRRRKFETPEGASAGDLAASVGGAVATKQERAEPAKVAPEGAVTSRLLDAKRRARERLGDEPS